MSTYDTKQTYDEMSDSSQCDDEPVQQNVIDTPTEAEINAEAGITGMIKSVKRSRNQLRNLDPNSSDPSPISNAAKQNRLNKIDPILIKTDNSV